jgi:uncharacterized protein
MVKLRGAQAFLNQEPDQEGLSQDSSFDFHCHAGLSCFNRCCRTPTILLSPYDILRLTRHLRMASGEFLRRYTRRIIEERSQLPLIFIDPSRFSQGDCPFLGDSGCTVYPQRPAACRLFPITMGSRLTPSGVEDLYFSRRLDYCQGFAGDLRWTLASWRADQGFEEYDQGRREWLEIILRQGLAGPLQDAARVQDLFAAIAYDPDEFRRLLSEPAFLQACNLAKGPTAYQKLSDSALLKLAYRCLKSLLFAEAPE